MQGEFRMLTDLDAVTPKELRFNYDELKAFLTEALQDYKTLVVTEDGISDAKAKRATLNKLADNINAYRINVKKQIMAQYDEDFKPKCDELVAMTKDASDNISKQIKSFERAEADRKIERLRAVYDAGSEEAKAFLPFADVFDLRWENKGYSEDKAAEEIREALSVTEQALASIRSIGGDDTPYLLKVYRETHSLSSVMQTQSELKEAREREARRRAEAEEERRRQEQAAKTEEQESAPAETEEPEEPEEPETVYKIDFRVWANRQQLMALKAFLKEAGIRYGRCD